MSKVLTADDILKVNDVTIEKVDVPEWGGHVFVRSGHSGVMDVFETRLSDDDVKKRAANFRASLVALTACDEQGNPIFTEAHVAALARKSPVAMRRVAKVALRLNGLSQESVDAEKKDSDADPSDASSSDSPAK
jgi:hypothetical protein